MGGDLVVTMVTISEKFHKQFSFCLDIVTWESVLKHNISSFGPVLVNDPHKNAQIIFCPKNLRDVLNIE